MLERTIEQHFRWAVESMGGKSYKFTSPAHRGVSDRVACMPDGSTWFVEIKTAGGRLSPLQKVFAEEMKQLNQNYKCFWNIQQIDEWRQQWLNEKR